MESNTWLPGGGLSPIILVKREGQVPSTCCSSQTGTGANIPLSQTLSPALTETVREPHNYHSHLPAVLASLTLFPLRIPEIISCCPFSFMPILSSQPQTLHLYFEPSVVYTSPSLPSSTHLQLLSLSTEIRGIHCSSPVTSSRSSVFWLLSFSSCFNLNLDLPRGIIFPVALLAIVVYFRLLYFYPFYHLA